MNSQFVSDVGVFSIAWNSKKAESLVSFVKRFEHALLHGHKEPARALYEKIKALCTKLDEKFPRTNPLIVEISRHQLYGGMQTKVSVKPSRRDGMFSDSYWIIITCIDVKSEFDFNQEGGLS